MKAIVTARPGDFGLVERPVPEPAEDEVRLKVANAGICRNDLRIQKGIHESINYPLIPGHQFSGVVDICGSAVKFAKPGDKAAVHSYVVCGQCAACRIGDTHYCDTLKTLGFKLDGGFAQYCVLPERNLFKLPDNVNLHEGAMVENLANAVAVMGQSNLQTGESVAIIGATPIGLMALQVARLSSPSTIVLVGSGINRLRLGQGLGAEHIIDVNKSGYAEDLKEIRKGFDVVIVCGKTEDELKLAMDIAGWRGRIVVEGHYDPDVEINFSPFKLLVERAVSLQANCGWLTPDFHRALNLLEREEINVKSIITHTFPLEDWEKGFNVFSSGENQSIQVMLSM